MRGACGVRLNLNSYPIDVKRDDEDETEAKEPWHKSEDLDIQLHLLVRVPMNQVGHRREQAKEFNDRKDHHLGSSSGGREGGK